MAMQDLIDRFDWSRTPIGPRDSWPQSLRTSVSICVASRFPILIWWGPDYIKIYNDAYAVILGDKHPQALGAPGRKVWPEIWHIIGPMLDGVMRERNATWSDDQLLMLHRHGYAEECFFTFSYSPIVDESGGVGGIFTAVAETTAAVVGERRLDTLRQLAGRAGEAKTAEQACRNAAEILDANPHDVPFAALYLRGANDEPDLICTAGAVPAEIGAARDWRSIEASSNAHALTLPLNIPGEEQPAGSLIAGVSPHRRLDDEYRTFFTLVAGHIASAIANAKAYELERQRAESLAELDRAKTAFFSNVSHEFRTPLTLMLGPLDDARSEAHLSPVVRERLDVAYRNAVRLLKLVNTLLDFSRIEAGRSRATYEPADLSGLTTELASVFRSAIERAGLQLVVDCPPLDQPVYVDREMWEKIVLNLLSNAFKFTFEGTIEVSLRRKGAMATLSVRDTGTGIPAEELPHLFERFHRVHGARGRTYEGSGIGLALVQELVKLHGGTASVASEAGRGSTFTIAIPLGHAHLPADRISPARQAASTTQGDAYIEEALRWLPDETVPGDILATDNGVDAEISGRSSARILVADDNADMRAYLHRLLAHRYVVETVVDGAAALESVQRRPPDLVLSDVMMPRMDGFALLKALREDARTRDVPIILLSARAGEESKVEGMEAGADDYLIKPFSARELLARVDGHLRLQRVRRDAQDALRASEEKFATAFDRSPLALTITSLDDGRLLEVNEGFVTMSGHARKDAIGRTPGELGLWVQPEQRAERFARLLAGEHVPEVEARFRLRNGEERIGMIGSALVRIGGRPCVLSSVTDITTLKRAEESKDAFLATLSHELRTPLTSGYGWVKLLEKTRDGELLPTGLRAIEESFVNQMKLIDDLLDVSRISSGKLHLNMQALDLGNVVDAAVEMVRPSAKAKNVDLRVHFNSVLIVCGDAGRLKQVVLNLLSNAIKFTNSGGSIDVELHPRGTSAEVVVRDTGAGIDAKFLPHVFDRFQQADNALTRKFGGLGLGLSIVRSLIEAHGGSARAESEGEGRGATFTLTIPLQPERDLIASPREMQILREPKLDGARVIVCDDDDAGRQMMSTALTAAGAIVRQCVSVHDAYDAVVHWRPDVLISDLAMPLEDGYSLIRRIRETGNLLPALAITAHVRPEDEARVRAAGFQRHVAKPFDPDELVRAVRELAGA